MTIKISRNHRERGYSIYRVLSFAKRVSIGNIYINMDGVPYLCIIDDIDLSIEEVETILNTVKEVANNGN